MNGPVTMYRIKPVVHFPDAVDISPTMYRMKNIYSSSFNSTEANKDTGTLPNILEQVNKLLKKPSSEVEELTKRQEAILKQLTYLKEQMLVLREELCKKNAKTDSREVGTSSSHQQVLKEPSWNGVIREVVVHASPDCPPYSLLAVNQLWPDVLRLHISCHTHSSILTLPPNVAVFSSLASTPSPTLNVRLVWKVMGPDCELVISPLSHTPIRGEVNLLRYLYRTICTTSDAITETKLDSVLDMCYQLTHARTQKDKQFLVRALNANLGKANWLGGDAMSVADIAAWSAVRSMTGVELTQNMSKWLSRCCAAAGVEAA